MRLLKLITLGLTVLTLTAQASLIVDNDDNLENSFLDTETKLVWMDFGVNNNQSYNYVISELGTGGIYNGWRLPTLEEVYTMWSNVADLDNVDAFFESPNQYGAQQFVASDFNSDIAGGDDSVWDIAFDAIGFNTTDDADYDFTEFFAMGWFQGTDGLSWIEFTDRVDKLRNDDQYLDNIVLADSLNYDFIASWSDPEWSTLLVRTELVASAPEMAMNEPSTFVVLLLALTGFAARRFRRL